jgi:hypothetical protein
VYGRRNANLTIHIVESLCHVLLHTSCQSGFAREVQYKTGTSTLRVLTNDE